MQHPSQQSELDSSLIAHSFGRFRHQECHHAGALCLFGFRCRYLPHSPGPASSIDPVHHSPSGGGTETLEVLFWLCGSTHRKCNRHPKGMASASSLISEASPIARARLLASQQRRVLGSLLHLCLPDPGPADGQRQHSCGSRPPPELSPLHPA